MKLEIFRRLKSDKANIIYKDYVIEFYGPGGYTMFKRGIETNKKSPHHGKSVLYCLSLYPSTVEWALEILIRMEIEEKCKTYTLNEFLLEYKEIKEEIATHFKNVKI